MNLTSEEYHKIQEDLKEIRDKVYKELSGIKSAMNVESKKLERLSMQMDSFVDVLIRELDKRYVRRDELPDRIRNGIDKRYEAKIERALKIWKGIGIAVSAILALTTAASLILA